LVKGKEGKKGGGKRDLRVGKDLLGLQEEMPARE